MKFLRSLFSKLFHRITYTPTEGYGEAPSTHRWGMIIGHDSKAQGAQTAKGYTEYMYNSKAASLSNLHYSTRDVGGVWGACQKLKSLKCNYSIELHLNAYNTKAKGFEVLVLENDKASIEVAKLIVETFKSMFPDRVIRGSNGLKLLDKNGRGAGNLRTAKSAGMDVAILIEPFFVDNPEEWINPETYAEFLNTALK